MALFSLDMIHKWSLWRSFGLNSGRQRLDFCCALPDSLHPYPLQKIALLVSSCLLEAPFYRWHVCLCLECYKSSATLVI